LERSEVHCCGCVGDIFFIGVIVSTWTARALHTEKLNSERTLAERRFEYDQDLAERKFRYEQDLHDHGRRVELAEQALAAIHEAQGALGFALIPARFDIDDKTRKSQEEESIIQQKYRDFYLLPIQRLIPTALNPDLRPFSRSD
jgi:hypothetical protein